MKRTMEDGGKAKGVYWGDMFLNDYEAQVKLQVQFEHFIACFYMKRCLEHSVPVRPLTKLSSQFRSYTVHCKEKSHWLKTRKMKGKGWKKQPLIHIEHIHSIIQALQLFVNDHTAKTQWDYSYFVAKKFRKQMRYPDPLQLRTFAPTLQVSISSYRLFWGWVFLREKYNTI